MRRRPPRTTSDERGFTIVEVLIAMLLLLAIASGIALAFASGTHLEQKRDLRSRMVAASERVYEHLRSDKDWIRQCRRTSPTAPPRTCSPLQSISSRELGKLAKDDILDTDFVLTATATGIDNAGDQSAGADTDGNVDDFFQVRIGVSVPQADRARLGTANELAVTSVINGSTNTESGALVVMFCGAANQVDERIQISSCPQRYTWFDMPDCAGTPNCAPRSLFGATPPPSPLTASRMVAMEPLDPPIRSIRLVKVGGEGSGTAYDGSASVRVAPGVYRFADLPTGTYSIAAYSLAGWIDWGTHHIPSTKQATVERQRTSHALVALRRPGQSSTFRMKFDREVHERFLAAQSQTFQTPWIPECEQPASFNRNAFYSTSVTCNTRTGHMVISMLGGGSMTASMEGLTNDAHEYRSDGAFKEIVTVKYIGQVDFRDYVWNGAAGPATFVTAPAPAGRYTERAQSGNNTATYDIPTARWTERIREAPYWDQARQGAITTARGVGTGEISRVPLGLNDGVDNTRDSRIGNVFQHYYPPGCDRRYLWVRPNGSFGSCSSLHYRGERNECYTTLSPNWTGVSYTRHRGCGGYYWPPLGGTIARSGYLVLQVCRQRVSRVTNIHDIDVQGYDVANGDLDYFRNYLADYGYGFYDSGSHTVAGRTVSSTRGYRHQRPRDQYRPFDLGCNASPTVQQPMVCPRLDDWSNCSTAFVLQIPATPGWGTSGDVTDGQRPPRAGDSMSALGTSR